LRGNIFKENLKLSLLLKELSARKSELEGPVSQLITLPLEQELLSKMEVSLSS
jgi:hypothetical protein